jgi:DNA-binding transcriptional MerR regulator/methylmalonyl-CoA mutase cobalamin-binding subunit
MKKPGYPIRAVSKLTGLSVDTLRAWERRYNAISPGRLGRGRVYEADDVERLRLLREAIERGYAIGQIARLSDKEIKELVKRSTVSPPATSARASSALEVGQVDLSAVLSAIDRFNYAGAERELNRLATLVAPRDLVYSVVIPLMREVGDQWQKGRLTIAQEHMVSSILRNLLGAIVRLYSRPRAPKTILLATPSGEQHEFGILAAAMLAAGVGIGAIYLGPGLPAKEIVGAARKTSAHAVVLGAKVVGGKKQSINELRYVSQNLPDKTELWIGGSLSTELERELEGVRAVFLHDLAELETNLARLVAEP